jgi:hypothetical protein
VRTLTIICLTVTLVVAVSGCGSNGGSSDPYVSKWCGANWQTDPWGDSSAKQCVQSVDFQARVIKETPDTFLQDLLNAAGAM